MDAISPRRTRHPLKNGAEDLFGRSNSLPEGFRYHANLLTAAEEDSLARELAALPFEPFDFHGYKANRQVVGFGFRYDYGSRQVIDAPPLPSFLDPLRVRIGEAFGRSAEAFQQVLINEYRPGAGIGWHRDKPHFDEVVGVSLLAPSRSASGGRMETAGIAFRSLSSRARPICSPDRRGPFGSTAFRRSTVIAIPSPSGRWPRGGAEKSAARGCSISMESGSR
jgi:alkylated DNA repair dioxygenase AlkB